MNKDLINEDKATTSIDFKKIPKLDYTDSVFFCFYIDQTIYNKDYFFLDSKFSNLSKEVHRLENNLTIFRVYLDGYRNYVLRKFSGNFTFKISYKKEKDNFFKSNDFIVEKDKVKFIYEPTKNGYISSNKLSCPSHLDQYISFNKVINNKDSLFSNTLEYLKQNLDMELYLYLLKVEENKRNSLLDLLDNFPYIKLISKNKLLQEVNFQNFQKYKNYNKLIIIYSIIQDSINYLVNFKENDLKILFQYNEIQKDYPLIIKEKIFKLFINKTNNINNIKKICKSCESIPSLFNYLISLDSNKIKEIKNIRIDDLPHNISLKDNLIELIGKYEKIKGIFLDNEIHKLWKKYLNILYKVGQMQELEQIKEKLKEINENYYKNIINEITNAIIKKGKNMINNKTLTNLEMYKFINKYNYINEFFSDLKLLNKIGSNINLKELENDDIILKEFSQCKFFNNINSNNIDKFILGTLNKINNFEDFILFFKYIYEIKEEDTDNYEKHYKTIYHIILQYISLLDKISNIQINENFKQVLKNVFLLSLMYDKKLRNNKLLICHLGNFFKDELLFSLFIDIFINQDIKNYVPDERKDNVCKYIFENIYDKNNISIEKKIEFLIKIKSLEIKEKYILNKIPDLKFEDFIKDENTDSLIYLDNFINKRVFNNKEILNSSYYKK